MRYIFSDLDGCILDYKGCLNTQEKSLIKAIGVCKEQGIILGLNSNRGYGDLEGVRKKWGIDGPIIIEGGAAIVYDGSLVELAPKLNFNEGEPANVSQIKNGRLAPGVYYDLERRYSLSIYVLGPEFLAKAEGICGLLKSKYPEHHVWYKNNGHVWCIRKQSDKGIGINRFREIYGGRIAMIGHDKQDLPALQAADYSAAPSNLEEGISVDYKSALPFTMGTIDCISKSTKSFLGGRE